MLTELATAVIGFASKDWMQRELESRLDGMVIMYRDDPDLQAVIDWMQRDWVC